MNANSSEEEPINANRRKRLAVGSAANANRILRSGSESDENSNCPHEEFKQKLKEAKSELSDEGQSATLNNKSAGLHRYNARRRLVTSSDSNSSDENQVCRVRARVTRRSSAKARRKQSPLRNIPAVDPTGLGEENHSQISETYEASHHDWKTVDHFVTPRRSERQQQSLRRRANYSLPDRLKKLEETSPGDGVNESSPRVAKTRYTRITKPVNNFLKERSEYNTERLPYLSSDTESEGMENFIVEDDSECERPEGTTRCKRKQNKQKKTKKSTLKSRPLTSESDDEIHLASKRKKSSALNSEEESIKQETDNYFSHFSEDELLNEVKELRDFDTSVSNERVKRGTSKAKVKHNKSLEMLKRRRETRKVPIDERMQGALHSFSNCISETNDEETKTFGYFSDTELDSENDFIVSDSEGLVWVDDFDNLATKTTNSFTTKNDMKSRNLIVEGTSTKIVPYPLQRTTGEASIDPLVILYETGLVAIKDQNSSLPSLHREYINNFVIKEVSDKEKLNSFFDIDLSSLNSKDFNNRTLLHIASICGDAVTVSLLLAKKLPANVIDNFFMTPLMYTALYKHVICYEILLRQSDLSICHLQTHKHFEGKNLLHFLVLSPANTQNSEKQLKCIESTKKLTPNVYRSLVAKEDFYHHTPVMFAIKVGCCKIVKALLDDSDVSKCKSEFGGNALHFAIQHSESCSGDDMAACLKMLLPKLVKKINNTDENGFTPLMYAAELGSKQCMQALLHYNAQVMCEDAQGTTALHLAALSGSTECVKLLLAHGHQVHCVDRNGWPPLLYANFQSHESCVAALMEANPEQIFVLSSLLSNKDEFQNAKNRKVVESAIVCLANFDSYYTIFNDFVRRHPGVIEANDNEMFTSLWRAILDFDNKLKWFRRRFENSIQNQRTRYNRSIEVNRDNVVESFFLALNFYIPKSFRGLAVTFKNEPAICEGPKREFVALFCKGIMDEKKNIFEVNSRQHCNLMGSSFYHHTKVAKEKMQPFSINEEVTCSREALRCLTRLKIIGRVLASFVADGYHLNIVFTKSFLKQVLKLPLTHPDDLESLDPDLYRSTVRYLMQNDASDLDLTFDYSTENPFNGTMIEISLDDNKHSLVTNENKEEYVKKLSQFKVEICTRKEIEAFCSGFYQEIPVDVLRLFTANDFALLINGVQEIDVADLKANTEYEDCYDIDNEVKWFWKILQTFKQEEKALLLKFWTGTPCVPIGGFKNMSSLNSNAGFVFNVNWNKCNKIPTASTCFNKLSVSRYDNEREMRNKLLIAVRHGSEGFTFS